MPHGVSKEYPAKNHERFFLLLLLPDLFIESAHRGKIRLLKKYRQKKHCKKSRKDFFLLLLLPDQFIENDYRGKIRL